MLSADTRRETIAEALEAGGRRLPGQGRLQPAGCRGDPQPRRGQGQRRRRGRAGLPARPRPQRRPAGANPVGTRREILGLLANGWSNRRIAEECFLSLNTVRTHVQNVLVKLGVHSKLEAVAFALEHQVVAAGAGAPPGPARPGKPDPRPVTRVTTPRVTAHAPKLEVFNLLCCHVPWSTAQEAR